MNEGMQNATAGWHNSSDHVNNILHVIMTKNIEINELIKSVMNVIHKINSQTDVSTNESQITPPHSILIIPNTINLWTWQLIETAVSFCVSKHLVSDVFSITKGTSKR